MDLHKIFTNVSEKWLVAEEANDEADIDVEGDVEVEV